MPKDLIFMINSEYAEIKNSIRQLKGVCNRIRPLRMGVACRKRVNDFELDVLRIIKKR